MPEEPRSASAVYTAAPTVRVDGQEYPMVTELLLAMEMTEQEGGLSSLRLRVSNVLSNDRDSATLAFEDDRILKLGARLAIYAGDRDAPQEIFNGLVTGLEAEFAETGPPELVVLAEDGFQGARLARRTKVWSNTSLADLAREVAGRLDLTPVVTGLTDTLPVVVQLNESDLAFLRRTLARYDADLQVVGREMHVSARRDVSRGSIDLALYGQLRTARAVADLADQVTEVTTAGWDAGAGHRVTGTSSGPAPMPGRGRAGADLLRDAFGARREHVGDPALANDAEATALAETVFARRARRFVRVTGTAEGNPGLRVGTQVNLSGMGRYDNAYYVVRACHRYDLDNGYRTEFEAECAFLGGGA